MTLVRSGLGDWNAFDEISLRKSSVHSKAWKRNLAVSCIFLFDATYGVLEGKYLRYYFNYRTLGGFIIWNICMVVIISIIWNIHRKWEEIIFSQLSTHFQSKFLKNFERWKNISWYLYSAQIAESTMEEILTSRCFNWNLYDFTISLFVLRYRNTLLIKIE